MNKLKNMITKSCQSTIVGIITSQLFIGPYAFSAEVTSSSASNVQAATSILQATGQGFQQVMGSMQQAQQSAAFQSELYSNNAQYLSENANYETGYPMPDQMFGVCQVPLTYMEIPLWCETPPTDLTSYQQMAQQFELARQNKEYYKSFNQESVNPYSNKGMKCLEERAMGLTKELTQLKDGMAKHVEAIGKIEEVFKRKATDLYNEMKDDKSIIEGGGQMSPAAEKWITDNLNDSQCKIAIDFTEAQSTPSKGLTGIQSFMGESAKKAKELISATPQLKQQFNDQLDQIRTTFKDRGLDGLDTSFLKTTGAFSTEFAPVQNLLDIQIKQFNTDFEKVKTELASYGITVPQSDKNFSSEAATELAAAPTKIKNSWDKQCMTEQMAVSNISYDQIWESVYQEGVTIQQGSTVLEFKQELQKIMGNTTYDLSRKISEINSLEARYAKKGAPIYVKLNSIPQQLSSLMATKQSDCTILYNRDDGSNKSPSQKISEAMSAFSKLKQDYEMVSSDIVNDLSSRVLNCSHEKDFTATKEACQNEERMSITSDKFCFKNSVDKCATPINGCYNKVAKLITEKKTERGAKAKKFNDAFDRLLVDRDIALERMKATYNTVNAQMKLLVKETKNAQLQNMDLGLGDLTVKPPVKALDGSTGEMLMSGEGGDWQSWFSDNAISAKWPTIQKKLDEQVKRIDTILKAEKDRLSKEYKKMADAWDGMEKKCDIILDEYAASSRKAFQDQQTCEARRQQFCQKAQSAMGPGCGDVAQSLSDDVEFLLGNENTPGCGQAQDEVWVAKFSSYCSSVYGEEGDFASQTTFGPQSERNDIVTAEKMGNFCSTDGMILGDSKKALDAYFKGDPDISSEDIARCLPQRDFLSSSGSLAVTSTSGTKSSTSSAQTSTLDSSACKEIFAALKDKLGNSNDASKFFAQLDEINTKSRKACDEFNIIAQDCKGEVIKNKDGVETGTKACSDAARAEHAKSNMNQVDRSYLADLISFYPEVLNNMIKNKGTSDNNFGEQSVPPSCGYMTTTGGKFDLGEYLIEDDTGVGALDNK